MAAQDLVNKLKETLGGGGGGDSHPEHPEPSNQPQHQHVSENTLNEDLDTNAQAQQPNETASKQSIERGAAHQSKTQQRSTADHQEEHYGIGSG